MRTAYGCCCSRILIRFKIKGGWRTGVTQAGAEEERDPLPGARHPSPRRALRTPPHQTAGAGGARGVVECGARDLGPKKLRLYAAG